MPTEIRTTVAAPNGSNRAVVQRGPRWVFDLWRRGTHRCSARTSQGSQCRRYVNLQAGVSHYCERHRRIIWPFNARRLPRGSSRGCFATPQWLDTTYGVEGSRKGRRLND